MNDMPEPLLMASYEARPSLGLEAEEILGILERVHALLLKRGRFPHNLIPWNHCRVGIPGSRSAWTSRFTTFGRIELDVMRDNADRDASGTITSIVLVKIDGVPGPGPLSIVIRRMEHMARSNLDVSTVVLKTAVDAMRSAIHGPDPEEFASGLGHHVLSIIDDPMPEVMTIRMPTPISGAAIVRHDRRMEPMIIGRKSLVQAITVQAMIDGTNGGIELNISPMLVGREDLDDAVACMRQTIALEPMLAARRAEIGDRASA